MLREGPRRSIVIGASMGGNVRVGLEDSLYAGKGRLAKSNAEQVSIVRGILESLSMEVATPAEARQMLHDRFRLQHVTIQIDGSPEDDCVDC